MCGDKGNASKSAAPVIVRAHIPEEVEGKLASLFFAVELIALLSLPQLVSKGVAQLVLPHVLLQAVQALDDLGVGLKAGRLGPLAAVPLAAALLLHFLCIAPHVMTKDLLPCTVCLCTVLGSAEGQQTMFCSCESV